jgi:ADP-ribose pyrophosphatase YjhB (NUDIX family)
MKGAAQPVVAMGAVVLHRHEVLLVKRANPPAQGQWSLPGGKLKLGESLVQGIRRELQEETGLGVEVQELLEVLESIWRADDGQVEFHYILLDYLCRSRQRRLRPGSDALDAAWFQPERLPGLGLWSETLRIINLALSKT